MMLARKPDIANKEASARALASLSFFVYFVSLW
jgi:hypothetical protein